MGMLELVDRLLKLTVQHQAVRDDDHLVEHFVVSAVVEVRKAMCEPGNRVRLARTGRVLHEIRLTGSVSLRVRFELVDSVPLVEARKDQSLSGSRPGCGLLDVYEAGE